MPATAPLGGGAPHAAGGGPALLWPCRREGNAGILGLIAQDSLDPAGRSCVKLITQLAIG